MSALDRVIPIRAVVWAFPFAFLVHDAEEVQNAESFWRQNRRHLPIPRALARVGLSTGEFAIAVVLLFAVASSISWRATRQPAAGASDESVCNGRRFLNVFTHVAQTAALPCSAYG